MSKPRIAVIAAIANNHAIGKDNQLLWHLPKDFQFFKKHTQNKSLIMGKNTWLSLPIKPLPLRHNIILSNTLNIHKPNVTSCQHIQDIPWDMNKENMIIGGASLYKYFLPYSDTLYLTHVNTNPKADTFFPTIDFSQWQQSYIEHHQADDAHQFDFSCAIYQKLTK